MIGHALNILIPLALTKVKMGSDFITKNIHQDNYCCSRRTGRAEGTVLAAHIGSSHWDHIFV
jgi:hypothetical protein